LESLRHVCMWSEDGWIRISANDAAKLYPLGTVSAKSGLFMCELCNKYVLLTAEGKQARHFRHNSSDEDKECAERKTREVKDSFTEENHRLPLKIVNVSSRGFEFEIGLIKAPKRAVSRISQITISPDSKLCSPYIYSSDRLQDGVTYLSIGSFPAPRYYIGFDVISFELNRYWNAIVDGFDKRGNVFESKSGKKLNKDSDVVVGEKYYILICDYLHYPKDNAVSVCEITKKNYSGFNWRLYEVVANSFCESAAKFFLDFGCRLTESPVSLNVVWPISTISENAIMHDADELYISLDGNANAHFIPKTDLCEYHLKNGKLLRINNLSDRQMLAIGRMRELDYYYIWKEELSEKSHAFEIEISDVEGNVFRTERCDQLPKMRKVLVRSNLDAQVKLYKEDLLIDTRVINADEIIEIDRIGFGSSLCVCIGLDIIRKVSFIKETQETENDFSSLKSSLMKTRDDYVSVPHELSVIADIYKSDPYIYNWIRMCIKNNRISLHAYKEIKKNSLSMDRRKRL